MSPQTGSTAESSWRAQLCSRGVENINSPQCSSGRYLFLPGTLENLQNLDQESCRTADSAHSLPGKQTIIVQPLISRTRDKRFYEYNHDQELLKAFRDALEGHKALCQIGILHRNIDPESICMTRSGMSVGGNYEGVVLDLDFAVVEGTHASEQALAKIPIQRGLDLNGTVQFMAHELIAASLKGKRIRHSVHHDVESFIWVLYCDVLRWLLDRFQNESIAANVKAEKEFLEELICNAFNQSDPKRVLESRYCGGTELGPFPTLSGIENTIKTFLSSRLVRAFAQFDSMVHSAHSRHNPTILTHESVINVID